MNCLEIQEKIIDLIMGELKLEEKALVQEHLDTCPLCSEDFQFLTQCLGCWEFPELAQFNESYWDEFVISIHEKILEEKPAKRFPYRVVVPIAASVIGAIGIGYFLFFRPLLKEVVKPGPPETGYDPFHEVYELSPEEQQEFIKMINQHYYGK